MAAPSIRPTLTDGEIVLLERVAASRARRWRVDPEDAIQQAWLACLQRMHDVRRYRQMGDRGRRSFRLMVANAADRGCGALAGKERGKSDPLMPSQVRALLAVVWRVEDWPQPDVAVLPSGMRAARPIDSSRIEDSWAYLHDLSGYLRRLRSVDVRLLYLLWGAGLPMGEAAKRCGLDVGAAESRETRAVRRLGVLLGRGEE